MSAVPYLLRGQWMMVGAPPKSHDIRAATSGPIRLRRPGCFADRNAWWNRRAAPGIHEPTGGGFTFRNSSKEAMVSGGGMVGSLSPRRESARSLLLIVIAMTGPLVNS